MESPDIQGKLIAKKFSFVNRGFLLAWRNIWRNGRRTLITTGAVAFACLVLSFMIAFQQSTYKTAIEASTSIFDGHLQVQRSGYHEDPQSYLAVEGIDRLQDQLRGIPEITDQSVRLNGFALLSSEDRTYGVQVIGVEPDHEPNLSTIPGTVRTGRYLLPSDTFQVVIGNSLAQNLHVQIGDELTLLGQGADGSMAAGVLTVVGIFQSGSIELDRMVVEIPLSAAQELFALSNKAHSIVLKSDDLNRVAQVKTMVEQLLRPLGDYSVLTWEELNPGLKEGIELDMVSGWLFFFSLILIVAFGVLNTFLMSLLERTREFGLLMSLGMTPNSLVALVSLELVFLLFLGFIPGSLLGALIILYFSYAGLSIPGAEEINQLWNLPSAIYPEMNPIFLLTGPLVVVVTTLVLVLPFSLRLRRLQPVEALRAV